MKSTSNHLTVFFIFVVGVLGASACWGATAPVIAQVTDVEGSAVIMSGTTIKVIGRAGVQVRAGDRIQTKKGSVEIVFNDGAIMNIHPYTSTMIQEDEESEGFGFWKKKVSVRRVTCFIGKLWFKSGLSKARARRNYLQTPTAVCGIRGSDGDIGFDGIQTYLNMYHGETDNVGDVLLGFFENPGAYVAEKSKVYKDLEKASKRYAKALKSGDPEDMKEAVALALEAAIAGGESLAGNPDPDVAAFGEQMAQEAQELLEEMGIDTGVLPPEPEGVPLDPEDIEEIVDPCEGADPCDLNCDGEISYEESELCGEYISQ